MRGNLTAKMIDGGGLHGLRCRLSHGTSLKISPKTTLTFSFARDRNGAPNPGWIENYFSAQDRRRHLRKLTQWSEPIDSDHFSTRAFSLTRATKRSRGSYLFARSASSWATTFSVRSGMFLLANMILREPITLSNSCSVI